MDDFLNILLGFLILFYITLFVLGILLRYTNNLGHSKSKAQKDKGISFSDKPVPPCSLHTWVYKTDEDEHNPYMVCLVCHRLPGLDN